MISLMIAPLLLPLISASRRGHTFIHSEIHIPTSKVVVSMSNFASLPSALFIEQRHAQRPCLTTVQRSSNERLSGSMVSEEVKKRVPHDEGPYRHINSFTV